MTRKQRAGLAPAFAHNLAEADEAVSVGKPCPMASNQEAQIFCVKIYSYAINIPPDEHDDILGIRVALISM